jgi:putative ABC transport system substrate-binding protein
MIFSAVFFGSRLEQLAMLAARHRVPARATNFANYSRGPDELRNKPDRTHRQAGEKPYELPVVQPTRFELVINLRTAKLLGLDIPQSVLAQADEVIE